MELKTCEYCGTAYDARLRQCPLCGRTAAGPAAPAEPERTSPVPEKSAQSAPAERPAPGRRLRQDAGAPKAARGYAGKRLRTASAPQPSDAQSAPGEAVYAIPKWMMTVLCVILGAAVLGGALLAFSMDPGSRASWTTGRGTAGGGGKHAEKLPAGEAVEKNRAYTAPGGCGGRGRSCICQRCLY